MNIGTISGTIVAANFGIVENCASIGGEITHTSLETESRIGGIIGGNSGTVKRCYNSTNIEASTNHVGGIVGFNVWENTYSGTVENCYNIGNITGYAGTGGIVGTNYLNGTVKNCYNIGNVKAEIYEGSVVGINYNKILNCYYLEGTASGGISGEDIVGQAEVRTSATMKTIDFVNLLGNSNWKIVSGVNNGYPILNCQDGTASNPTPNAWLYKSINLGVTGDGKKNNDGSITLINGTTQYGPYTNLDPGTYQVRYEGINLNKGNIYATSNYNTGPEGPKTFDINKTTYNEDCVIYTFNVTDYTTHIEFACKNISTDSSDITVKFIELIRLN